MAHTRWIAMLLAAAVVVGCQTSTTEDAGPPRLDGAKSNPGPGAAGNPGNAGADEPLRLDGAEAAALLGTDEDRSAPADTGAEGADNYRCLVCHGNFADEELSVDHAVAGVGCEKCHGPSDAHCDDENNITPPDLMYPRDGIVKACMTCHPADTICDKEQHWDAFAPKTEKTRKVCTECHGKHRIATRDVRWNKKTGQLIKGGWMEEAEK